jgi:hypothetical protein
MIRNDGAKGPQRIWTMRVLAALLISQFSFLICSAQTEPEYRLEIGGGLGTLTYLGDFNSNIMKNPKMMFSLLAKYKPNPRSAVALNLSYGRYKGDSKNAGTYYPLPRTDYKFEHGLFDAGIRYELNFWPYGTGQEYRGAKRITPYIYIGLGVTVAQPDKTEMGVNMPVGGGVKYKAADRVNMAVEWTIHFTGNDRLDGVKDPYGITSSGLFKNTDCYSNLRLTVTYDLWEKCRVCHNDKD